jgi:hypothetical protein
MATLLSLTLACRRTSSWQDRTVHTGIWKEPVDGPRMVHRLNVDRDGQVLQACRIVEEPRDQAPGKSTDSQPADRMSLRRPVHAHNLLH